VWGENLRLTFRLMALNLVRAGVIQGRWVVIDSTGLEAFFKADPEARWGYRRASKPFYGYKLHLVVDAFSELPIALEVTPGNVHDSRLLKHMLHAATGLGGVEALEGDAAYDSKAIREYAQRLGVRVIIPRNPRRAVRRRRRRRRRGRRRYAVEHANSRLKDMLRGVRAMGMRGYTVQGVLASLATLVVAHSAYRHGLGERVRCTKTLIQRRIMHHPF